MRETAEIVADLRRLGWYNRADGLNLVALEAADRLDELEAECVRLAAIADELADL